jgi:pimeloyl-ACP methyl ester carboxylesterase
MSAWQTGDVQTNGIRTHYLRSGGGAGGKQPLVLLHGATDNGSCWLPVAERLADDYDVLLPDARGHGLSAAPPDGYSSAERAADVVGLITALDLGRVAVGGHSMGGQTAFRLAADYPEHITCAILEDPPFRPTAAPDARLASVRERMREEIAHLRGLDRQAALDYGRHSHPTWSAAELPAWVDAKLQVSDAFMASMRGYDEPPWTALLPRISCPLLLVTGDPQLGAIITPEIAEQARQLNPKFVEVVHLAGAGHNIRRERFDAYLQAVRGFLEMHAARPKLVHN